MNDRLPICRSHFTRLHRVGKCMGEAQNADLAFKAILIWHPLPRRRSSILVFAAANDLKYNRTSPAHVEIRTLTVARYLCHFSRNGVHLMDAHGFSAEDDQKAIDVVIAIAAIILEDSQAAGDAMVSLHRDNGGLVLSSSLSALLDLH